MLECNVRVRFLSLIKMLTLCYRLCDTNPPCQQPKKGLMSWLLDTSELKDIYWKQSCAYIYISAKMIITSCMFAELINWLVNAYSYSLLLMLAFFYRISSLSIVLWMYVIEFSVVIVCSFINISNNWFIWKKKSDIFIITKRLLFTTDIITSRLHRFFHHRVVLKQILINKVGKRELSKSLV